MMQTKLVSPTASCI